MRLPRPRRYAELSREVCLLGIPYLRVRSRLLVASSFHRDYNALPLQDPNELETDQRVSSHYVPNKDNVISACSSEVLFGGWTDNGVQQLGMPS